MKCPSETGDIHAIAMVDAEFATEPNDPCAVMYYLAPELFAGVHAHVQVLQYPAEARGSVVAAVSERHRDGRAVNSYVVTDCVAEEVFQQLLCRLSANPLESFPQPRRQTHSTER